MMGIKEGDFQTLLDVSLEDLAPADHFYHSFVRDLLRRRGGGYELLSLASVAHLPPAERTGHGRA